MEPPFLLESVTRDKFLHFMLSIEFNFKDKLVTQKTKEDLKIYCFQSKRNGLLLVQEKHDIFMVKKMREFPSKPFEGAKSCEASSFYREFLHFLRGMV
jgi:hypothetical protein